MTKRLELVADRLEEDPLAPLLTRFSPSARLFYSGTMCGLSKRDYATSFGYLHLLRNGMLSVTPSGMAAVVVDEPSVVIFPRPHQHFLRGDDVAGASLVCATIDLGSEFANPLAMTLPSLLVIPLRKAPTMRPSLDLLFEEAGTRYWGRQAALDRLLEFVLIVALRHVVAARDMSRGLVAGLGDPRLFKSLTAMHERPQHPWRLETLAAIAGMSRARFSDRFHRVVGTTALAYLGDWRLSVARSLLKRGEPIKAVALSTGYRSQAAFSRAFARKVGMSPTQWAASDDTPRAGEPMHAVPSRPSSGASVRATARRRR